jgi:hypothetical protein
MIRRLLLVTALAACTAAATITPAPAIDFICSCKLCTGQSGPACRDLDGIHPMWTSCGDYYPTHCR